MPSLIGSDIWRDGGSLSAVVLDRDGPRSFWLQTNSWNHPRERGHEHLFVSEGTNPESKVNRIDIASIDEHRWLDYLLEVEVSGANTESKKRFQELLAVLQARRTRSQKHP